MTRAARALAIPTLEGEVIQLHPGAPAWAAETSGWLRPVKRRGRSEHTLRMYRQALDDYFTRSMIERGRSLELRTADDADQITRQDATEFVEFMQRAGLSKGTQATRWSAISALFTYLEEEEVIEKTPIRRKDRPEAPEPETPVLRPREIDQLLRAVRGKGFLEARDELVIRLLLSTGLRRAELAGVLLEDLDELAQEIRVLGKGAKGRGPRIRTVTYGEDAARAMRRYLRHRDVHPRAEEEIELPEQYGQIRRGRPLLLGRDRGRLAPQGIADMLTKRGQEAGLGRLHPHQLRHTWTDLQLRSGARSEDVARLGGWRSTRMLQRYGSAQAERALASYRDPMDQLGELVREEDR